MERKSAYTALAEWFEYLNDDCGYEKWSQYLLDRISAYSPQAGLDVGCGSGYFTRFFEEQGYAMTGSTYPRRKRLLFTAGGNEQGGSFTFYR